MLSGASFHELKVEWAKHGACNLSTQEAKNRRIAPHSKPTWAPVWKTLAQKPSNPQEDEREDWEFLLQLCSAAQQQHRVTKGHIWSFKQEKSEGQGLDPTSTSLPHHREV